MAIGSRIKVVAKPVNGHQRNSKRMVWDCINERMKDEQMGNAKKIWRKNTKARTGITGSGLYYVLY